MKQILNRFDISRRSFWGPLSWLGVVIAAAGFLSDRLSKWWLIDIFEIESRVVVPVLPFFDLVMAWNKGISYGLFQADTLTGRAILIGFAILVCTVLFIWLARVNNRLMAVSLGLIIGGAVGNIYDRIAFGAVADFFSLHGYGFYWYIFNVADIWIAFGVGLMMYDAFFPAGEDGK
jgi:signal peptidase II